MLRRLLAEPLIHFLALALVIFAAYHALAPAAEGRGSGRIVVSVGKIEQIAARFAQVWQRPPGPRELKALIDDQVMEEIYVREALALGLDKDDTVIRRRLRQKMELLGDSGADALTPTEAELEAYLQSHRQAFALQPAMSFEQVFLNPRRHGAGIGQAAAAVLVALKANPEADASALGDASLLPAEMPLADLASIGHTFGEAFAEAIGKAEAGGWTGPIASGFGLHVVRVGERRQGRVPALGEVREAVLREWSNDRRKALESDRLAALLRRYEVSVESPPAPGARP
jgi:parvulin-like peptidyl-prolyl cis-trans isomerase-like protein